LRAEYDFSKGKWSAVIAERGKTRIPISSDNAVLAEFRGRAEKAGAGYQTKMNEALLTHIPRVDQLVTEEALRRVLLQEMPEYFRGLTTRSSRRSAPIASRSGRQGST
jgi:hypothetical protein